MQPIRGFETELQQCHTLLQTHIRTNIRLRAHIDTWAHNRKILNGCAYVHACLSACLYELCTKLRAVSHLWYFVYEHVAASKYRKYFVINEVWLLKWNYQYLYVLKWFANTFHSVIGFVSISNLVTCYATISVISFLKISLDKCNDLLKFTSVLLS